MDIIFYFALLFVYKDQMVEDIICLYVLAAYPASDFLMVFISAVAIKRVKRKKHILESKQQYKKFSNEMENKLKEILYLPIAYESDVPDDEDD